MKKILIHGSGHKADSYNETIKYMNSDDVLLPDLSLILNGKKASYDNLYSSFIEYCNKVSGKVDLCGLSLGGILALNYALDFPDKVNSLVLIGTPYKVPKSMFDSMAFNKKDTFILGKSMKNLDFSGRVSEIKCKTLIICGEKDKANIKSAYYLAKHIKNSELKIIEKASHIINEECPKVLANILNEFYN